jgi:hypothetical protein
VVWVATRTIASGSSLDRVTGPWQYAARRREAPHAIELEGP